jgi:GNAT superfamily N-acetyltransferase
MAIGGYHVRRVAATDAAVITHHAHGWGNASDTDRAIYKEWVASAIERGLYFGRLAMFDHVVIAGAGAILFEGGPVLGTASPIRARLVNVFTEPAHRNQGVSTHVCERVLNELRERGVQSVALACTSDSRHVYEKLGFKAYPSEMRLVLPVTPA